MSAKPSPLSASSLSLMKRLLTESVRPYTGKLVLALILMALASGSQALSAWLMKPIVNEIFVERNADMLIWVAAAVFSAFTIKGLAQFGQSAMMSWLGLRVIADLQMRLHSHLSRQDIAFFHANPTGTLISRFTNDIGLMRSIVSNVLTSFGKDLTAFIGFLVVMFITDWQLAIIAFLVFPIAMTPVIKIGRRVRKVTANTQVQLGEFMTVLDQTFSGIRHVKAYCMEKYEQSRVADLTNLVFRLTFKAERTKALSSPIMESLAGVAITGVILYGGHRVINGAITPGDFFAFITAALMTYEPAKRLANLNANMQAGLAGAERLFHMLDTHPSLIEKPDATALHVKGGHIQLVDVDFAYDAENIALRGLNIDIPAGKTAALVGPSGAGKSTILNLIPRFYDVTGGSIFIDDQDIRDVTFDSLRMASALVSQEVSLFDDTVRANIAYGRWGASEEEIISAAKHAAAHDFIINLPEGYNTRVGEDGVKLSGGQRQRLSIARAILKNAPILLLDEATSALDTESERHVQKALEYLMQDRTTLVIAHRLSTIVNADVIFVIDKGRVAEQGSHAELIALNGIYAKLYAMQFAEQQPQSGVLN